MQDWTSEAKEGTLIIKAMSRFNATRMNHIVLSDALY